MASIHQSGFNHRTASRQPLRSYSSSISSNSDDMVLVRTEQNHRNRHFPAAKHFPKSNSPPLVSFPACRRLWIAFDCPYASDPHARKPPLGPSMVTVRGHGHLKSAPVPAPNGVCPLLFSATAVAGPHCFSGQLRFCSLKPDQPKSGSTTLGHPCLSLSGGGFFFVYTEASAIG